MIIFKDGTALNNYSAFMAQREVRGRQRETLEIHLRQTDNPDMELSYEWLKSHFADGTSVSIRETIPAVDEEGKQVERHNDYSYPEHNIAGPITDNMDGTFAVCLCKKTEAEILEEENAELILSLGGI